MSTNLQMASTILLTVPKSNVLILKRTQISASVFPTGVAHCRRHIQTSHMRLHTDSRRDSDEFSILCGSKRWAGFDKWIHFGSKDLILASTGNSHENSVPA